MLNQSEDNQLQQTGSKMPQLQFGGHEIMDAHEAIGAVIGGLEHYNLSQEQIQDQTLAQIAQRHREFLTQLYNTIIDTFQSGQEPNVKTQTYHMQDANTQTTFGVQQGKPKTPIQNISELTDECISGSFLGHLKGIATHFTTTALEATHPVLRRIFADSVPNVIEMAYEIYLYQNKHAYYQVPQYNAHDTQAIINSFAPIQNNMTH